MNVFLDGRDQSSITIYLLEFISLVKVRKNIQLKNKNLPFP